MSITPCETGIHDSLGNMLYNPPIPWNSEDETTWSLGWVACPRWGTGKPINVFPTSCCEYEDVHSGQVVYIKDEVLLPEKNKGI
jgi:hypothetical protein